MVLAAGYSLPIATAILAVGVAIALVASLAALRQSVRTAQLVLPIVEAQKKAADALLEESDRLATPPEPPAADG